MVVRRVVAHTLLYTKEVCRAETSFSTSCNHASMCSVCVIYDIGERVVEIIIYPPWGRQDCGHRSAWKRGQRTHTDRGRQAVSWRVDHCNVRIPESRILPDSCLRHLFCVTFVRIKTFITEDSRSRNAVLP